ncbi:MAG: hypothetical protein L6R36_008916 [Xanthoria steineri]|nr:MAG: hypothetical protein L6R36_008916 [Xanthoria steineri]
MADLVINLPDMSSDFILNIEIKMPDGSKTMQVKGLDQAVPQVAFSDKPKQDKPKRARRKTAAPKFDAGTPENPNPEHPHNRPVDVSSIPICSCTKDMTAGWTSNEQGVWVHGPCGKPSAATAARMVTEGTTEPSAGVPDGGDDNVWEEPQDELTDEQRAERRAAASVIRRGLEKSEERDDPDVPHSANIARKLMNRKDKR